MRVGVFCDDLNYINLKTHFVEFVQSKKKSTCTLILKDGTDRLYRKVGR